MKLIGEGRESSAYFLDGKTVLLVGKNKTAIDNYKKQKTIYNILDGKVKCVKIPENANLIEPCEKHPFGAMTISYVAGEPLDIKVLTDEQKIKIGKQIAQFVYEFQKVGEKLGKEEIKKLQEIQIKTDAKAVRECLELVKVHFSDDEYSRLVEVAKRYNAKIKNRTHILHQGDLGGSNLLTDKDRNLIGIIDFEEVGFYIPEYKFKGQGLRKDKILFDSLVKEYHKLSGILVNDTDFMDVCEIITMILHLRRFYCLGSPQIEMRVGIIKKLLQDYFNGAVVK
ncbi:MAG: phosphotransferase [Firmicutes bacterium]|nr:phosphotransferase [Bacillota bacterium]